MFFLLFTKIERIRFKIAKTLVKLTEKTRFIGSWEFSSRWMANNLLSSGTNFM